MYHVKDGLRLKVPTLITDVDDNQAAIMLLALEGRVINCRLNRGDTISVAEWRRKITRDDDFVERAVQFYAVASEEVLGSGEIVISSIRMSSNLHVDVEPLLTATTS